MKNYRALNELEYYLYLARSASSKIVDKRAGWLLYLQLVDDLLGESC